MPDATPPVDPVKPEADTPPPPPPPPNENKPGGFFNFAQKNTRDTIAYILLILGIIWIFFNQFYGDILVGIVAGLYFSEEIMAYVKSLKEEIDVQGTARSLILAGTLLAIFISAPGIFLGFALVIILKQALTPSVKL